MNNDEKRQHQRPEGALLEQAMKKPPKISGRKLAEMVDLSEGRIRQIVNGYKSEAGMILPIVGPADTVARLGSALEIDPAAFEEAGRSDVAEIMRGDITSGVTEEGNLWLFDDNEFRLELLAWLETGDETVPPPEGPLMLWEMGALLRGVSRKHRDETVFLNNLLTMARNDHLKGGDGDADATAGGSAPTKDGYDLVADQDGQIDEEAEADPHA